MFMTTNISTITDDRPSPDNGASLIESESQLLIDTLQKIVQHAGALLEVDNCAVALLDAERNMLITLASIQEPEGNPRRIHFQTSEDVASWVAEHRETVISNDVSLDPRFKQLSQSPKGSIASMPLIDKHDFIGTLTVSSAETDAFSPPKLRMLAIFAEQALLVILHARQAELARREATRVKANFLSMITHELRSPLNAINGYLDLILAGIAGELNEQQREFVQRARAGSEHLFSLIEDLLLLSRADAGQLRLNRDVISLQALVANAIEELELVARDSGITTKVEIASDFPPIYADAVRMQQVLRNLLSNALRFTTPGGSVTIAAHLINKVSDAPSVGATSEACEAYINSFAPVVSNEIDAKARTPDSPAESTRTSEDQQQVEVQVRDTGYGIALEHQQRIFERFYQVPLADTGRLSGQGLGLAIVKIIVELHGGQVTVESKPGEGSVFKFTLPNLLLK
jgi:signal transduction histidine kinase